MYLKTAVKGNVEYCIGGMLLLVLNVGIVINTARIYISKNNVFLFFVVTCDGLQRAVQ